MKIVIPTPIIGEITHPAGLTRSETDELAQGLTAALAGMGIRVDPSAIEILPNPE